MKKINVSGIISASADKVWKDVSDFGALDQFVDAVEDCTIDGSGRGAIRTLTLQDGGVVKEKLESLDNESRILIYSIEESPMPIDHYTGTMKVKMLNEDQSEFTGHRNLALATILQMKLQRPFRDCIRSVWKAFRKSIPE